MTAETHIVAKLPQWLSSRWNRALTMFQDEHKTFPDFRYVASYLTERIELYAIQPIKPTRQQERSKQYDQDH